MYQNSQARWEMFLYVSVAELGEKTNQPAFHQRHTSASFATAKTMRRSFVLRSTLNNKPKHRKKQNEYHTKQLDKTHTQKGNDLPRETATDCIAGHSRNGCQSKRHTGRHSCSRPKSNRKG